MRDNNIRAIWKRGGAVINGWLGIPSSVAAENMAQAGWDSLTVDLQHGLVDYQTAVTMLQAISTTATVPLARVPWLEPGIIMKLLDAGAYGIVCPMINSRAECEAFVGACRYPPRGYRSSGPIRAALYGGADYHEKANETILAMAMIETAEALDHLDEILSTPGLDGIYVGPSDLSLSFGLPPGLDKSDERMLAALTKIVEGCKRHKVVPGIHTGSTAYAKKAIAMGFRFVTLLGDARLLTMAGQQVVREMREGVPAPAKPSGSPY